MVRRSPITNMFAASPVRPLQQHMQKVRKCVNKLVPFFQSVIEKDFDTAAELQQTIHHLEVDADTLKQDLRMHLPSGLFMPMPRERILDIITSQDRIANKAKDIAGIVTGRKMTIPQPIAEIFMEFVERCVDATRQAEACINELDELVETGFRGREVTSVEEMIAKLDNIEYETDKLEHQIRAALFVIEKDMNPIDAMFLYQTIEWIGNIADISQQVGSRLQLLLAR